MFGVAIHMALSSYNGHKKQLRLAKDLYQLLQTSISDWSNKKSEKQTNKWQHFGLKNY